MTPARPRTPADARLARADAPAVVEAKAKPYLPLASDPPLCHGEVPSLRSPPTRPLQHAVLIFSIGLDVTPATADDALRGIDDRFGPLICVRRSSCRKTPAAYRLTHQDARAASGDTGSRWAAAEPASCAGFSDAPFRCAMWVSVMSSSRTITLPAVDSAREYGETSWDCRCHGSRFSVDGKGPCTGRRPHRAAARRRGRVAGSRRVNRAALSTGDRPYGTSTFAHLLAVSVRVRIMDRVAAADCLPLAVPARGARRQVFG